MLHTLCCGSNIGVYGQVWGSMVPRNEGVPLADCDFMAVWTLHPMYQQYRLPGSTGYFGTHMLHTLCCKKNIGVYGQVWGALVPRNEDVPLADCNFMAVWSLHPMYQQYWLPGSKVYMVNTCYIPSVVEWILAYVAQDWDALVPRIEGVPLADYDFMAVWSLHPMYQQYRLPGSTGYLVHTCNIPSAVEWILAYMAKFGVPWFPETKASLWQIVIFWQSGPLHPMYQQYRLPGSKGYLVHTCYIPSVVELILAYMASFGVPWFPETKASLWPIVILWQSGPCTLCTSNIGSLGRRAIWYTHFTYPLLWNEYWRIWPSLGCLGSQKRRRPSGRLWFYGSLVPAPNVPAILAPWVKGLYGKHMLHTLCCGMNIGVPWFPETNASLWQIVIFWQSGPCTLCTSNIGSLGQRAIWYTHVTYPLLWNEYWRIWPSLGCLGAQKRRRPSGTLWFYGSLVPAPYVPAISAPWVKGLFGTHMLHTLCCGMNIGVYD